MLTTRHVLETARLTIRLADIDDGRGFLFLARMQGDDTVAASVNLSNIVRGAFQAPK
jgi:hypothetical protein